jgi:hypothetical protein
MRADGALSLSSKSSIGLARRRVGGSSALSSHLGARPVAIYRLQTADMRVWMPNRGLRAVTSHWRLHSNTPTCCLCAVGPVPGPRCAVFAAEHGGGDTRCRPRGALQRVGRGAIRACLHKMHHRLFGSGSWQVSSLQLVAHLLPYPPPLAVGCRHHWWGKRVSLDIGRTHERVVQNQPVRGAQKIVGRDMTSRLNK